MIIAKDDLSEREQKVVMYTASQVTENSKAEEWYEFEYRRFAEVAGIKKNGELYDEVMKMLYELQSKRVLWQDGNGIIKGANFIISPTYLRSGVVKYKLDENLLPHYKKIAEGFTVIDICDYMEIRGKYPVALYELLLSWRKKGKVDYTIQQIRNNLKIPDNYTANDVLRRLISAVKEINSKSQAIQIKMTEHRGEHRKIEGFTFYIRTNQKPLEKARTQEFSPTKAEPTLEQLEADGQTTIIDTIEATSVSSLISELVNYGVDKGEAVKYLADYGEERLRRNIDKTLHAHIEKKKRDLAASIVFAIQRDLAQKDFDRKAAEFEKKKKVQEKTAELAAKLLAQDEIEKAHSEPAISLFEDRVPANVKATFIHESSTSG